jgi:hypothetical protein
MVTLSRRTFLAWMGVSAVAINLRGWSASAVLPQGEIQQGRALVALEVLRQPRSDARVVGQRWPDSVLPIRRTVGAYFEIPGGYVRQSDVQPMVTAFAARPAPTTLPFWAEVRGAVSAVRAYAAADAPLRVRIGHGGVLQVVERLTGDPDWYGVADASGRLMGWAQAGAWSPVALEAVNGGGTLHLDSTHHRWRLEQGGQVVGRGLFASGRVLARGQYAVQGRVPGGVDAAYPGASWCTQWGSGLAVGGAYWHNHFGQAQDGCAVQLAPAQARWCYECLGQDGTIIIE